MSSPRLYNVFVFLSFLAREFYLPTSFSSLIITMIDSYDSVVGALEPIFMSISANDTIFETSYTVTGNFPTYNVSNSCLAANGYFIIGNDIVTSSNSIFSSSNRMAGARFLTVGLPFNSSILVSDVFIFFFGQDGYFDACKSIVHFISSTSHDSLMILFLVICPRSKHESQFYFHYLNLTLHLLPPNISFEFQTDHPRPPAWSSTVPNVSAVISHLNYLAKVPQMRLLSTIIRIA